MAALCDRCEPCEHGLVFRSTRHPNIWDHNRVVVSDGDPGVPAAELAALADRLLGDLDHRKVLVEDVAAGERLRPGFEALGYRTDRLLTLRHTGRLPPGEPVLSVEQASYEETLGLRRRWHLEDFDQDPGEFLAQVGELHARDPALILVVRDGGEPIAYTELLRFDGGAEVHHVYVAPDHRGRGLGTALTRAAIEAGSGHEDLWIVADYEGRPKALYERLGFRPVTVNHDFTRLPPA